MSHQLYQNSGRINPSAIALIPLIVLGAAAIGWVYTMILYVNPIIYLSIALFAGFCFLLGLIAKQTVKLTHCRNLMLAILIGVILGGGITYVSHATLYAKLFEMSLVDITLNPAVMWEMANLVAEQGYFSIDDSRFKGGILWGTWGAEALGLLAVPLYITIKHARTSVYCESCKRWADEDEGILAFGFDNIDELKQSFLSSDFSFLEKARGLSHNELSQPGEHYTVDEEWCKECNDLFTLSLRKHKRSFDNKNNLNISTKTLVEDMLINKDTHEMVRGTGESGTALPEAEEVSFHSMLARMLALMVIADGSIDEEEVKVMLDICNKFSEQDMSEEEIRSIIDTVMQENTSAIEYASSLQGALNFEGKAMIVKATLMIAYADNEMSEEEHNTLLEIATGLGLNNDEFNKIIEEMTS